MHVQVDASQGIPGEIRPGTSIDHPLSGSGVLVVPIYCRRDDYMFLPPTALGGLPCAEVSSTDHFDPLALAVRMEAELPPPDLRIGMNPALGMVAVPTWFWVEGYDGGTLSQSETVVEAHEQCRVSGVRDASGVAVLDADGRPKSRRSCTVETTTFVVDVRLWPSRFAWDFGDGHSRDIACSDHGNCGDALGQPFVDSAHESPVKHPYQWSSLGVNGAQDAYTVNLGISFAAEYRVSLNGSGSGWQSLSGRKLTWSASHQVQEAQAVLTRP
ncbi:MAG: hypothetical protein M3069_10510 [Chloroflexota bacterium]|nr:hypothetical protein [Chloroflexota bacterium]